MLSDVYTPIGIYLRLRDRFRDTVLLESADNRVPENSYSYIGINAIAGMEITNYDSVEIKYPLQNPERKAIEKASDVPSMFWSFMNNFEVNEVDEPAVKMAQGLFGYCTYDAVQFFETIELKSRHHALEIPLMRYRLYQYVIVINHFKDEMFLCENIIKGLESEVQVVGD